jgi:hypothetical protein
MLRFRRAGITWLFFAIASAAADEIPSPEDAAPTPVESFLQARLRFWQERLNLQNWKVTIVLTPRTSLKPGTLGGVKWDKSRKTAVMAVLDSSDYRVPNEEMRKDMEFTVVHELIHLELASLPRSEASRGTEEHAVNNLARALLGLSDEPAPPRPQGR